MSRTQITLYGHEKVDVHFFQVFYVCVTAWPSQGLPIINVEIPLDLPDGYTEMSLGFEIQVGKD